MTEAEQVEYPECEKLSAVADKRTVVLDFIEWCRENGIHLMHSIGDRYPEWRHITQSPVRLSHQYLEIDDVKLEQERRHMIDSLQNNPVVPKVNDNQR